MTKDELYTKLKDVLVNDFDIEESSIKPEANIVLDLDLDSIDAVELIVKMKPLLNGKIEPEIFKSVKTVQDVVDILEPLTK
ncbi:acyl carrier protein [Treponema sp.]|uniref:acyl carrier protein n=1 Tax=Treponema sp. TaxID=166 RepID=UPI0038900CD3